ncbi:MAG TPA: flagellar basal-body rod protein FlgG [Halanaerobiales bacterium]|nr:flagellar basal-body rod protein FlgG [Halanaerobiales bacterium]
MISALWTAATGMDAQQLNIDTISNNLANVNTTGFKKSRVNFQDMMYQRRRQPGTPNAQGAQIPIGIEVGHGARVSATQKIFTSGDLQSTGNPLDIVIEGDGFFQILLPDGTIAYTRDGSLKQDIDGRIVTSDGYFLQPEIFIPQDATEISITSDGMVVVQRAGGNESEQLGQIQLARFSNPAGLNSIGRNLYEATDASGGAMIDNPSSPGYGTLVQNFLEMSNVRVVEEMVNMISAQRAYEVNSKAIQAADEMLSTASQLRR